MKTIINNKNQKGFSVLAVILVIVAVIVAIGVWALSGQTNTSNTGTSNADIQASSIINDAAAIKTTYDSLIINGATWTSIVFIPNTASTSTAPNILDPTNGIQVPKVSPNLIKTSPASSEGFWVFNKTAFMGNNVGSPGGNDPVVLVAGVKNSICQRINYILYGSTNIPQFAISDSASTTTGATTTAPTTTVTTDSPGYSGWPTGCFHASAGGNDDNVFFRVLQIR